VYVSARSIVARGGKRPEAPRSSSPSFRRIIASLGRAAGAPPPTRKSARFSLRSRDLERLADNLIRVRRPTALVREGNGYSPIATGRNKRKKDRGKKGCGNSRIRSWSEGSILSGPPPRRSIETAKFERLGDGCGDDRGHPRPGWRNKKTRGGAMPPVKMIGEEAEAQIERPRSPGENSIISSSVHLNGGPLALPPRVVLDLVPPTSPPPRRGQ